MRHPSRRQRTRWLTWLQRSGAAVMAVMMLGTLTVAFAAVTLPPDAEYSRTRLGQESQGYIFPLPFTWANVVPNALASYYTYVPFKHSDAVALGFPSTCGNKSLAAAQNAQDPDWNSTDDCYTITVKRFNQQMALPGILGGGSGLKDQTGTYFGAIGFTDVYGYGSGGVNWTPPQFVNNGTVSSPNIHPVSNPVTVTGNAPAPFTDGTFGTTGIWHFPAPSIKGTFGRKVRVQWLNELPNTIVPGFDPTVDCSSNAPDCFPYNRMVVHVHGAHVGPESDGLAHASFNPDFSVVGTKFNQSILPSSEGPPGTYVYPMDQEASTIWYHDHAVGTTHLNVNQGLAGFFPITDSNEQCLQGIGPACTKILPTGDYELGLALQDRIFYTDGQFAMPDAPIIDANFPTCNPATPASRLSTCAPLFMYVKHAANTASLTPAGVHLVPYDAATLDLTIPENAQAPVLATSATLEFFGNMPVVNGVVYGKYDIEPRVYRIRFLGGTDSRTWVLQFQRRDTNAIIPSWMIGSEQGLLNNPVSMPEFHLMPGERIDVLVDFTGIPVGTKIVLNNLGPDTPFQGEALPLMARSVDIPEIMEFNTIGLNAVVPDVPTPAATTNLRPLHGPIVPLTATPGVPVRVVALEEIVDEYGRVMPTIDRRGYDMPGIPATEIVKVNDTEIWDIINTSADAHTIHLHQVKFQVVHRQPFLTFTPAVNDPLNGIFSQPTYTAAPGTAVPPDPRDAGWKDTDEMLPGAVTRIIATFDLVGEYVWHCHILSHEEHDMMRPMIVAATAADPPVSLTVPAAGGNSVSVTIGASPTHGVNHVVEYKLLTDTTWKTNLSTGLTQTVTFNGVGDYELRAKAVDAALTPTLANSTYVAGSNTITVSDTTPPTGTILINGGAATTTSFSAVLTLSASDTQSAVTHMQFSKDGGVTWVSGPWEPFAVTRKVDLTPGDGVKTIDVRYRDAAGNVSLPIQASITVITDITPPTGTILINGGAATTASASAVLTLSASDTQSAVTHMQFSKDGGVTWVSGPWEPFAVTRNVTLTPGYGVKTIDVRYRDAAGNISLPIQATITYTTDTTPPTGTILINGGAPTTASASAVLTLSASDAQSAVTHMQFSKDGGVTWVSGPWEPFAASRRVDLTPGYGVKTIDVRYRDAVGNVSLPIQATIIFTTDITPPAGTILINGGAATTASASAVLTLSASDAQSAVTQMQFSKDGGVTWVSAWEPFAASRRVDLTPGYGVKTIDVRYRDAVGNVSLPIQATIIFTNDITPPTGTILINGGAPTTASASAVLTLSASDAQSAVTHMQFSKDGGVTWVSGPWEPFAASRRVDLTPGYGVKTIDVRYRDAVGNVSLPIQATITYTTDITPPAGTILINGGAATTASPSAVLTLSASDTQSAVTHMQFSKDGGVTWVSAWEPFAVTRNVTLISGAGLKTIDVRFRDAVGNVSQPIQATITML